MIGLSDVDILSRLTNFEDAFVERKSTNDSKDVLKTAVAFANSTPIGYPAILFYGVTDKGEPEGKANLDSLQKTISDKLADAYPAIYYLPRVLQQNGKQFLAVIIPGSEERPHFAGHSFIREGSKSVSASKEQFDRMIAERNSKVREIRKWINKVITCRLAPGQGFTSGNRLYRGGSETVAPVRDCNSFYATVNLGDDSDPYVYAYPLNFVDISYDCETNRLLLVAQTH
jgi:hypothetical protein